MRSLVPKVLCGLLSCCFLALCLPPVVSAKTGTPVGDTVISGGTEGLSYYEYSRLYDHAATAQADISLAIENAATPIGTGEYLSENAVRLTGDTFIEWTFTVPEDALYTIELMYAAESGNGQDLKLSMQIDGVFAFKSASSISLKRIWHDSTQILKDSMGNDLVPVQKELFQWQWAALTDDSGYISDPYRLYFATGEHTVKIKGEDSIIYLADAKLAAIESIPDYPTVYDEYMSAGYEKVDDVILSYQAENTYQKSSQTIYPIYDRGGAATVPNSPWVVKRNMIGGAYWKQSGDWLSYRVEAPKAGLYQLSFKYRQNMQSDMSVFRSIYINGKIPFKEFQNVAFPYVNDWSNLTVRNSQKNACYVYLDKGENIVTLKVTIGGWSQILQAVDEITVELNALYRRIVMVTGTNPDTYRDYHLENEINDLKQTLEVLSKRLYTYADDFNKINLGKSSQSATLRTAADQLTEFFKKPSRIPSQLNTFRENITSLSDWLQHNKAQQLELDYFMLHSDGTEIPKANGSFLQNLKFAFWQFIAAFGEDYGDMDNQLEQKKVISIWINDGRDQAQLLKDCINDSFSSKHNIGVNVNLVNVGIIEAVLSGRAPDVMVGAARGQPVNLACRNALYDLTKFSDFSGLDGRFADDAMLPYTYNDGVYALPMTQYFLMLFYRTDIFAELGLNVPDNWNQFMDLAAYLQRNNMKVGLPYTAITASGAVDFGVGAKDLFPTLLMQHGGRYYNDDLTQTALDSAAALDAFKMWTSFYTDYGFDLSYDLVSLFRSGEMPLAVAGYSMYGMIDAVATEIHGNWEMAVMPGMTREDGTVDRAGSASGSAVMMLKDASDPEACWEFMKWLTSTDTQADFGNRTEGLLGVAARYATANLEAFDRLNWTENEKRILGEQRSFIRETEEIPGSYYTSRCIDNAFRDVVYYWKNPRKSLKKQNDILNNEISRKIQELE